MGRKPQEQVQIDVKAGRLTPASKTDLQAVLDIIKQTDGGYLVTVTPLSRKYTPSRYKYYFDCIMGLAFPVARKFCGWNIRGAFVPVSSPTNLHEWIKIRFNPRQWVDPVTGETRITGASTTEQTDGQFIDEFQMEIMAYFAQEPFFIDFPGFEQWQAMHESKQWFTFKKNFLSNLNTL